MLIKIILISALFLNAGCEYICNCNCTNVEQVEKNEENEFTGVWLCEDIAIDFDSNNTITLYKNNVQTSINGTYSYDDSLITFDFDCYLHCDDHYTMVYDYVYNIDGSLLINSFTYYKRQ